MAKRTEVVFLVAHLKRALRLFFFAHLFEKAAKGGSFSRVDHWKCENYTHLYEKCVARKQPRLFERGKVTACFYENTHLPVSAYQFGLSRVVRFQRHCFFPFFQLLPSIFTGIAREKRKKLKHILWKWNFQKESCRSFLKILDSISSSILIPAGPIALLQAFLVWY